jgi:hypothetical protein
MWEKGKRKWESSRGGWQELLVWFYTTGGWGRHCKQTEVPPGVNISWYRHVESRGDISMVPLGLEQEYVIFLKIPSLVPALWWMLINCIRTGTGISYILIYSSLVLNCWTKCWLIWWGFEQESAMFSYVLACYLLLVIECWLIALDLQLESVMFSYVYSCLGIYCW